MATELPLYSKARVKKPGIVRRFLLSDQERSLVGRVGTIGYIEIGQHSQAALYSLIFEDGPEMATGCFFANELELVAA